MYANQLSLFNSDYFLNKFRAGKTELKTQRKQIIYSQGDPAEAVFYILKGRVILSVVSHKGKEAILSTPEDGEFFGETCLAGQPIYNKTATSSEFSSLFRIEKRAMIRVLHQDPSFSDLFMSHLLSRNIRVEEDLVDQLFNSSEKRLARLLLLMAHVGENGKSECMIPKFSQEALAEMIGTTRSRVSFFMNKFKKRGFIDTKGGLRIYRSLMNIILYD